MSSVTSSDTAPGSEPTAPTQGRFYTTAGGGERLVDWLTRLVERKPIDDVRRRRCRAG